MCWKQRGPQTLNQVRLMYTFLMPCSFCVPCLSSLLYLLVSLSSFFRKHVNFQTLFTLCVTPILTDHPSKDMSVRKGEIFNPNSRLLVHHNGDQQTFTPPSCQVVSIPSPLVFTGRKLRPLSIGIEVPGALCTQRKRITFDRLCTFCNAKKLSNALPYKKNLWRHLAKKILRVPPIFCSPYISPVERYKAVKAEF